MGFSVRQMASTDRAAWARMRTALWPDAPADEHAKDIDAIFAGTTGWGFVAQAAGAQVGFAEITCQLLPSRD
jgi:hypothetical protein